MILLYREKCNRDEICASECTPRIIVMDTEAGYPVPGTGFEEFCLKCGHCVSVCPTEALRLDRLAPEDYAAVTKEKAVTPQQARQLLRGRRSIRSFKEKKITQEVLQELIEVARYARSGRGASDQVDDRFVADQASATPVLSDKGKHPMLYLVPFAGTRRKMADMDAKPGGIRQMLNPPLFHNRDRLPLLPLARPDPFSV